MVRSSEIKLHNKKTAIEVMREARTPGSFMHLLAPIPNVEDVDISLVDTGLVKVKCGLGTLLDKDA
jgi:hypothetical protein